MARCYPITIGEISPMDERLDTSLVGALPSSSVQLVDDWGDGATITLADGSDENRGTVTIVTGTTPAAANPRWQLAFNNLWTSPSPFGIVLRQDGARMPSWSFVYSVPSTMLVTQGGAISTSVTIVYSYMVIG